MFKWLKDKFSGETIEDEKKIEKVNEIEETQEPTEKEKELVRELIRKQEGYSDSDEENAERIDSSVEKKVEEEKSEGTKDRHIDENVEIEEKPIEDIKETQEENPDEIFKKISESEENDEIEEITELSDDVSVDEDKPQVVEIKKDKVKEELGFFEKLKQGLTKTRDNITEQITNVLNTFKTVDEELFEELEEILIMSDVGIETTMTLIDNLREEVKTNNIKEPNEVLGVLKNEIQEVMTQSIESNELNIEPSPAVVLVVGVNGVGKTTTIGKMANRFKEDGKSVLIAAGDTFRAAAIEQLEEWGNRANVDIVSHSEGSDPAAVIFDAVQAAKARKTDVLICDTAGRLHNKSNLMNELNKIFRVVDNEYPEATKEVLLVLDATTGQNAMSQAKTFKEVSNITGIALTKLDGTAKGGVVIALQSELGIPIKFVGVGEGMYDLQPFDTEDFVSAIFEE